MFRNYISNTLSMPQFNQDVIARELGYMRFCDVWTINLHLSLTLKRKTKGRDVIRIRISPAYRYQLTKIHIGPGGWYVYYKERCMWKKNRIYYFKQLFIRRNSSNSEGYRNSNSVCTMGLESLRCLLHHCSSGQWWRKANEIVRYFDSEKHSI